MPTGRPGHVEATLRASIVVAALLVVAPSTPVHAKAEWRRAVCGGRAPAEYSCEASLRLPKDPETLNTLVTILDWTGDDDDLIGFVGVTVTEWRTETAWTRHVCIVDVAGFYCRFEGDGLLEPGQTMRMTGKAVGVGRWRFIMRYRVKQEDASQENHRRRRK